MPFNTEETKVYRDDVDTKGHTLSIGEREALITKYLPTPEDFERARRQHQQQKLQKQNSAHRTVRRRRIRPFLKQKLHFLLYWIIQSVFGIYIRLRQIASALFQKFIAIRHYHHRTPAYIQKDVKNLSRLPEHLSVLLRYDNSDDGGLETLLDEVAELSAWSAAAGIPLLSVYEQTGVLKQYMSALQELIQQKLVQYFGPPPSTPTLQVFAPNLPSLDGNRNPQPRRTSNGAVSTNGTSNPSIHLNLLLISESDGRDTLVDLTRTLTEMAQSRKIRPKDITAELIDTEISATTAIPSPTSSPTSSQTHLTNGDGHGPRPSKVDKETTPTEPDLLIVFAPYIQLHGYPPWQLRLTEIFCVKDSGGDVSGRRRTRVEYQGFLRGLWSFAGAQFRFGR